MKITTERNGSKLTNIYHLRGGKVLIRETVGSVNAKGEPIATLISNGQSDEIRYPAAVMSHINQGQPVPAKYYTCIS